MTLEELSMRLTALEDSAKAERDAKRQQEFMDKYGNMFSNNRDIGIAILNQLDKQGVDTSAAGEAIQSIIQDVLMECAALFNIFKNALQQQGELLDKVSSIAQAVDTALLPQGADIQSMLAQPMPGMPPEGMPPEDMPPEGMPPEGMPPEGMPPEGMPPEGAGTTAPPPPEGMPPEGAGNITPPPPPPEGVTSDRRVKSIIRTNSMRRL